MASSSGSLSQKRILVTDVESDFGREIANALVTEGALVLILVKECRAMQQVLETYPQLTPVLLDISKEKGEEQAKKLLLSLPTVDHFVNLSGDSSLNIISQCYTNAKIHDVSDTKVKPVISKMNESGGRALIFHVTFGNQNIMSKLKANLDPRFTNSKTAQFSANLRFSLKKMFSNGGGSEAASGDSKPATTTTPPTSSSAAAAAPDTIVRETHAATNFAAIATTLNQNGHSSTSTSNGNGSGDKPNGSSNGAEAVPGTRSGPTTTARLQTQQERNLKIRESVLKLQKTCAKKWKKAEKRIGKQQKAALKSLQKDIAKTKKIEKSNLLKTISDANASTASRAKALSSDTANQIIEAREKRAEREAEKHAEKRLEKETTTIVENKETQLTEYHEKLYKKMVGREINEFNRIKSKYFV